LAHAGLDYGVAQAKSQHQFDATTETCALLTNGCACYKNSKKLPPMRLGTLKTLKNLLDLRIKVKGERISADRADAIVMKVIAVEAVMEDIAAED
jgi:hypothetical protein